MGLGQIIDTAIGLFRSHWRLLVGTVAWVIVPLQLINAVFARGLLTQIHTFVNTVQHPNAAQPPGFSGLNFGASGASLLSLLTSPFLSAAIAVVAASIYLSRPITVGEVYRRAIRRFGAILVVVILAGLIEFGGLILLIIPGIFFWTRLVTSPVVVMLEGLGPAAAIRRSWRLAKGFGWKILGTVIVGFFITGFFSFVVQIPFGILAYFTGGAGWVFLGVGQIIGALFTAPFQTIILVLIYFDLRIRREAFDLSMLAEGLQ
jgi:hypothetical protein